MVGWGGDNLHNTIGIVYSLHRWNRTAGGDGWIGIRKYCNETPDPMIALLGNRKYAILRTVNITE